jgi:hypothetical protein
MTPKRPRDPNQFAETCAMRCDTSNILHGLSQGPNYHTPLIWRAFFWPVTPEVAGSSPVSRAIISRA